MAKGKVKPYLETAWRKVGDWVMIAGSIQDLCDDIESLDVNSWNQKYEIPLGSKGFKDEKSFRGTLRRTYNYLKKYKSYARIYPAARVQVATQRAIEIEKAYKNRDTIKVIKKIFPDEIRIYYVLIVKYIPAVAVPGYFLGRSIPLPKRINSFYSAVLPSQHPDLVGCKDYYISLFSTYTYENHVGGVYVSDISHSESFGIMPESTYTSRFKGFNPKDLNKYIGNDFAVLHDKHEDWLIRFSKKNPSVELFIKKQSFVYLIIGEL